MRSLLVPHDVDASHAAALPAKRFGRLGRLGPWIRADATWRDAILITGANFSRMRQPRGITPSHRAVTSPAFAQSYDPSVGSGDIARAQSAPPTLYRGGEGAFARVAPSATHRRAPSAAVQAPNYPVYDEYGHYVGADPDPNIRFQLHRDADSIGGF